MKRLLWLGAGLAIGALVVRAVTKKARAYRPSGIAAAARDSGRNLLDSAREFVDDVREGMHQREQELREALEQGVPIRDLDEVGSGQVGPDRTGSDQEPAQPAPAAPPEGTIR